MRSGNQEKKINTLESTKQTALGPEWATEFKEKDKACESVSPGSHNINQTDLTCNKQIMDIQRRATFIAQLEGFANKQIEAALVIICATIRKIGWPQNTIPADKNTAGLYNFIIVDVCALTPDVARFY
ncbi:hypothetical protein TDB9533_00589 [Thalassocella blandensis]|nr:hypothetical protein TDB9533_00589 [Thalassocella blandensis]